MICTPERPGADVEGGAVRQPRWPAAVLGSDRENAGGERVRVAGNDGGAHRLPGDARSLGRVRVGVAIGTPRGPWHRHALGGAQVKAGGDQGATVRSPYTANWSVAARRSGDVERLGAAGREGRVDLDAGRRARLAASGSLRRCRSGRAPEARSTSTSWARFMALWARRARRAPTMSVWAAHPDRRGPIGAVLTRCRAPRRWHPIRRA